MSPEFEHAYNSVMVCPSVEGGVALRESVTKMLQEAYQRGLNEGMSMMDEEERYRRDLAEHPPVPPAPIWG